jgi:hypothetical protein
MDRALGLGVFHPLLLLT